MYIVIACSPDGDSYSIHESFKSARKSFDGEMGDIGESGLVDNRVLLASVPQETKFGFDAEGEFFGGEIISEFSL